MDGDGGWGSWDANSATYSYLANSPLVSQIVLKQNGTTRMTSAKTYDYLNRLTSISAITNSVTAAGFAYDYNSANQRTTSTRQDSSRVEYQYDTLGQVTNATKYWRWSTLQPGEQFAYAYDDIGNRTGTTVGGDITGNDLRSASYTANSLNQYTSRDVPGAVDILGEATNNASVTVNDIPATHLYDQTSHRLKLAIDNSSAAQWQSVTNVAVVNRPGTTDLVASNYGNIFLPKTPETFGYDQDGNMTNDGRWYLTWDGENRLLSMTSLTNTPTASKLRLMFTYDQKGRRTSKRVESFDGSAWSVTLSNLFVYDGWNLVAELNGTNNALIRSYQWGTDLSGSMQGAGGVGGLVSMTVWSGANAGSHFCAYDGNGNVSALISAANGTVAAVYEYGPFGEVIRATGPMAKLNPFRFSTKYQDDESDLLYYGMRWYSQSVGRWLSRDPIEDQNIGNLTLFVRNDPVDTQDVLGLAQLKYKSEGRYGVNGAWTWTGPTYFSTGDQSGNSSSPNAWYWHYAEEEQACNGGLCNTPTLGAHNDSLITASAKNKAKCPLTVTCSCSIEYELALWSSLQKTAIRVKGHVLDKTFNNVYAEKRNSAGLTGAHSWLAEGVDTISSSLSFLLQPGASRELYFGTPSMAVPGPDPGAGYSETMKGNCSCSVQ